MHGHTVIIYFTEAISHNIVLISMQYSIASASTVWPPFLRLLLWKSIEVFGRGVQELQKEGTSMSKGVAFANI